MSEYHSPQDLQKMWEDAYQQGIDDEKANTKKVIDEVIQILILFDIDTVEKKKEIINALEQIKEQTNG